MLTTRFLARGVGRLLFRRRLHLTIWTHCDPDHPYRAGIRFGSGSDAETAKKIVRNWVGNVGTNCCPNEVARLAHGEQSAVEKREERQDLLLPLAQVLHPWKLPGYPHAVNKEEEEQHERTSICAAARTRANIIRISQNIVTQSRFPARCHFASSEATLGAISKTSGTTASISVSFVRWFTIQARRQNFPLNSAFER